MRQCYVSTQSPHRCNSLLFIGLAVIADLQARPTEMNLKALSLPKPHLNIPGSEMCFIPEWSMYTGIDTHKGQHASGNDLTSSSSNHYHRHHHHPFIVIVTSNEGKSKATTCLPAEETTRRNRRVATLLKSSADNYI